MKKLISNVTVNTPTHLGKIKLEDGTEVDGIIQASAETTIAYDDDSSVSTLVTHAHLGKIKLEDGTEEDGVVPEAVKTIAILADKSKEIYSGPPKKEHLPDKG